MISPEAEDLARHLNTIIEAKALAHRKAYEAIIQVLEQVHGSHIRSDIIRAFQGMVESNKMLSDEDGDFRSEVADEMQAFVEDLLSE